MVSTSVSIKVNGNISIQDRDIFIYRGDKNIKVYFTIDAPYKYSDDMDVENSNAVYAQLVIRTPNDQPTIFSEVRPTEYGVVVLIITAEMINELVEIGDYDYQIRLYDVTQTSRVSIPPIIGGIKVLEPIDLE